MSTHPEARALSCGLGIASVLALAAGCSDLFGPHEDIKPEMRVVWISYLSATSGILRIDGFPSDTAFRLTSGQHVPVEIVVSSGDREGSALYPAYCPVPMRGWGFMCFEFDVGTRDGVDVLTLNDYVAGIGGRFQNVGASHNWAHGVLFDLDDMVSRVRKALAWPGVAYVELGPMPFCLDGGSYCLDYSQLTRPVHVEIGSPHAGDGTVQVQSGDTVTVLYKQPNGRTVQAQSVVP